MTEKLPSMVRQFTEKTLGTAAMSELCGVLEALDEADSNKDEVVLATVVKAEGSGYRRPGARVVMPRLGPGQASGEPRINERWEDERRAVRQKLECMSIIAAHSIPAHRLSRPL